MQDQHLRPQWHGTVSSDYDCCSLISALLALRRRCWAYFLAAVQLNTAPGCLGAVDIGPPTGKEGLTAAVRTLEGRNFDVASHCLG